MLQQMQELMAEHLSHLDVFFESSSEPYMVVCMPDLTCDGMQIKIRLQVNECGICTLEDDMASVLYFYAFKDRTKQNAKRLDDIAETLSIKRNDERFYVDCSLDMFNDKDFYDKLIGLLTRITVAVKRVVSMAE